MLFLDFPSSRISDDALVKVAAYFGTLEPARPALAPKPAPKAPAQKDPLLAGKAAAEACVLLGFGLAGVGTLRRFLKR